MKRIKHLFFWLTLLSANAFADNVVTYVEETVPKIAPKSYMLSSDIADNAYISVVAEFSNPVDRQCVQGVKQDAISSLFSTSYLDLGLSAKPFGFYGVKQDKTVALASYSYSSENQYCKSSWHDPIVVVPLVPFQKSDTYLVGPVDPSLVIQFSTSANPKLSIIEPVQGLIGIAGALATGGAATTVVGIAKVADGPAVDFLNKEFEKRRKTVTDGTLELKFTWSDVANGMHAKRFKLISGPRGYFEAANDAIAHIKAQPKSATNSEVLDVIFRIHTRRSVFVSDSELVNDLPPPEMTSSISSVLNYPHLAGVSNIFQRINSEAPSVIQTLADKPAAACDAVIVAIRDLGFNKIDRALIIGALLDQADPSWRANLVKYDVCFRTEPNIKTVLSTINPNYFPPQIVPPPVFREIELFTNLPGGWPSSLTDYMSAVRTAFFSKGDNRLNGMNLSNPIKEITVGASPGVENLLATDSSGVVPLKLADVIKNMQISQAGCIFGFFNAGDSTWRTGMVVTAKELKGNIEPYIVTMTFTSVTGTISPSYVSIMPILSPMAISYDTWFDQAKFENRSICARKTGMADGDALLKSLRVQ